MACLGAINYDPGTAVTKGTAASAMAAFDTTNARITFTVPASGRVLVRVKCQVHGATTFSSYLLGVMEGATVVFRAAPMSGLANTAVATAIVGLEVTGVISGLTPSSSKTYDAAWGCETFVTASLLKYGGPDSATANNAFGALTFEVWEA